MARAARHPSPEVRALLVKLMKIRKGPHYRKVLMDAVMDRDDAVRMEAVRQISFLKDPYFKKKFLERVESKEFAEAPQAEKIAVCKSLAAMGGKEVEPLFIKWLEKRALLHRGEADEMKIAAAEALGVIGGDGSREALVRASGSSNPKLAEVCSRILRGKA
jgi:HEAT repeat protein